MGHSVKIHGLVVEDVVEVVHGGVHGWVVVIRFLPMHISSIVKLLLNFEIV